MTKIKARARTRAGARERNGEREHHIIPNGRGESK